MISFIQQQNVGVWLLKCVRSAGAQINMKWHKIKYSILFLIPFVFLHVLVKQNTELHLKYVLVN
jgi:hypothetical protein